MHERIWVEFTYSRRSTERVPTRVQRHSPDLRRFRCSPRPYWKNFDRGFGHFSHVLIRTSVSLYMVAVSIGLV